MYASDFGDTCGVLLYLLGYEDDGHGGFLNYRVPEGCLLFPESAVCLGEQRTAFHENPPLAARPYEFVMR
jgi:hypothetical protein